MKKFLTLIIVLSVTSCTNSEMLKKIKETDKFVFYCTSNDVTVVEKIDKVLEENYQRICKNLNYDYDYKIIVEIFTDQKTYDENVVGQPGTPACSGNRKMQLVSPLSPINIKGIPYEERLHMAVHEFVHLVNNEINNDLPAWLEEGIASYEGSKNIYQKFCEMYLSKLPAIDFAALQSSYYQISGADIYSYSVVRFIIKKYGREKFNLLIRNPENFEEIFSIGKNEFSKEWNASINKNYK